MGQGSLKSRDGVQGAEGMPTVEMELGSFCILWLSSGEGMVPD